MLLPPQRSTLFPYTTLFRSHGGKLCRQFVQLGARGLRVASRAIAIRDRLEGTAAGGDGSGGDRKSTRLNSSHLGNSYAVFCLKKKKADGTQWTDRALGENLD